MKSVKQVTTLTGISARTLQYYDEIGLLKPSELTAAGYRLYNDDALQKLQQILFFKELGFKLIQLLSRLEKGEQVMSFKEFDLTDYISALEAFKQNSPEAMKYNLEHFSEIMEQQMSGNVKKIGEQSDALYAKLVADRTKDVSSSEVQDIVREIDDFLHKHASVDSLGDRYWNAIINSYKSDYGRAITDTKYGSGAADYIVNAFQYYADNYIVNKIFVNKI